MHGSPGLFCCWTSLWVPLAKARSHIRTLLYRARTCVNVSPVCLSSASRAHIPHACACTFPYSIDCTTYLHFRLARTPIRVSLLKWHAMITFHSHPYLLPHPVTERRLLKRINSFFAILRTPEYHVAYSLWSHGLIPSMPWAPDPFDLSVSKRNWEASIQTWRNALQRIARHNATAT